MRAKKELQLVLDADFLLADMIPTLQQWSTQKHLEPHNNSRVDGQKWVQFVFCHLVKAICSPEMPLALFLDDLQWARLAPLGIMSALLTDKWIQGFVLLGAC